MSDPYIIIAKGHVSTVLGCTTESLSAEDTIETIETWDSLNHMRLILHLEEKLGYMIDTDDTLKLFTISGIAEYLKKSNAQI